MLLPKEVATCQTDGYVLAKPPTLGSWCLGSGVTLEIVHQRNSLLGRYGGVSQKAKIKGHTKCPCEFFVLMLLVAWISRQKY